MSAPSPGSDSTQEIPLHEQIKPSLGGQVGRVHRLWRTAITSAVRSLDMTESRWTVMVHLEKARRGVYPTDAGQ